MKHPRTVLQHDLIQRVWESLRLWRSFRQCSVRWPLIIILTCTFLTCTLFVDVSAQQSSAARQRGISEREVKLSGNYHWGEGFSEEREVAVNQSRKDLAERMVVMIVSDQSSMESASNAVSNAASSEAYQSDYQSSVQMLSRMELRGLDYMTNQRRDGSWEAIAYISKRTHSENLARQTEQIHLLLDKALELESKGIIPETMPIYRDIYLETLFHPERIFSDDERHGFKEELRRRSRQKLLDYFDALTLNVKNLTNYSIEEQPEIYIELQLTYKGERAEDLSVRLNREGYGWSPVEEGVVKLYYDRLLDNRNMNVEFQLAPNPEAISDPALREMASELLPSQNRSLSIDFGSVIGLDVEVIKAGKRRFQFLPVFENLSVFDIVWEVNGAKVTEESQLDYTFENERDPANVTLRLNRDDELSLTKRVWPDGRVEEVGIELEQESTASGSINAISGRSRSDAAGRFGSSQTVSPRKTVKRDNARTSSSFTKGRRTEFVTPQHDRIVRDLETKTRLSVLLENLSDLQQGRLLQYGNRSDVQNTSASYMAITDPSRNRVITILSPQNKGRRLDLSNDEIIPENQIRNKFKGYGPVYIHFLRN